MNVTKQQILEIIRDLPEKMDIDELMYRLYLMQKVKTAEKDVREKRLVSHMKVGKETSKWSEK